MRHTVKAWLLWLHKWIGIGLGVIVFLWLVSGMLLIIPSAQAPGLDRSPVDYRGAVVSPSDAAEVVARQAGDTALVRRLGAVRVLGRSHYMLDLASLRTYFVDMQSGALLEITPDVAGEIARQTTGLDSARLQVTKLTGYNSAYMRGPLPSYRIDFDDPRRTAVFLSPRDGVVRYTTRALRVKAYIAGFHTFDQLLLLRQSQFTVEAMLHFTSVLGIALVLSGYYLVLPKSWVRRSPRRREEGGRRTT